MQTVYVISDLVSTPCLVLLQSVPYQSSFAALQALRSYCICCGPQDMAVWIASQRMTEMQKTVHIACWVHAVKTADPTLSIVQRILTIQRVCNSRFVNNSQSASWLTDQWWCSWCSSRRRSCRGSVVSRPSHPQCWYTVQTHPLRVQIHISSKHVNTAYVKRRPNGSDKLITVSEMCVCMSYCVPILYIKFCISVLFEVPCASWISTKTWEACEPIECNSVCHTTGRVCISTAVCLMKAARWCLSISMLRHRGNGTEIQSFAW